MFKLANILSSLRLDIIGLIGLCLALLGGAWNLSSKLSTVEVTTAQVEAHIVRLADTQAVAARETNKQLTALSVQTGVLIHRVKQLENDLAEITYTKGDGTVVTATVDLDSLLESGQWDS